MTGIHGGTEGGGFSCLYPIIEHGLAHRSRHDFQKYNSSVKMTISVHRSIIDRKWLLNLLSGYVDSIKKLPAPNATTEKLTIAGIYIGVRAFNMHSMHECMIQYENNDNGSTLPILSILPFFISLLLYSFLFILSL